ncbi:hypothetical protein ACH4D5_19100 [Streptomyces sp. NPDC018029]|uniref:hypothetical protein n=1 Tax=Streptomyces sp. NPDC018029 TaxID=3365032 RepID=UPI0037B62F26
MAAVRRVIPSDKVTRCTAVIIPADGGDTLPLLRKSAKESHALTKDNGRWREVTPAHNQTAREELTAA